MKKQLIKGQKKLIGLFLNTLKQKVHRWHDVRMTLKDHAEELYTANSEKLQGQEGMTLPCFNTNCILIDCQVMDDAKENESHRFELTFQNEVANAEEAASPESSFTIRSKYLFECDGTKSVVRSILPKEPNVLLKINLCGEEWRQILMPRVKLLFIEELQLMILGRSALIFPGRNAGSSWTVISDRVDGKSESLDEAKERVLEVLETMNGNRKDCVDTESESSTSTFINPEYDLWMKILKDTTVVIENKLQVRDFDQP